MNQTLLLKLGGKKLFFFCFFWFFRKKKFTSFLNDGEFVEFGDLILIKLLLLLFDVKRFDGLFC